ncbi:hypothetical protein MTX26_25975 [Bradyrhizobium sp. ISRA443]|uniref:hypothetical protein n=1 Tax=unclassified Bradyrhizobium TaxID=2631580 RepID=UPI00247AA356|nr:MULTISPECIES: hypothetical protein [unclassified Bradyrhizobium]WGR97807.1 hypothetical protein MTX23_25970 [Bradyrhizobium sp. ISRA436]WGS04696.1 hypothetical protein MTX18_25975 [Bradyrhizobium sp. ISRA437]WGS11577.1 hypothetical protein MTX26_25975 [Bradyrhizobium sp. ISRA443]
MHLSVMIGAPRRNLLARLSKYRFAAHIRLSLILIFETDNGPALPLSMVDQENLPGAIGFFHFAAPICQAIEAPLMQSGPFNLTRLKISTVRPIVMDLRDSSTIPLLIDRCERHVRQTRFEAHVGWQRCLCSDV